MITNISDARNDLCKFTKAAQKEPVYIKNRGSVCAVIVGFKNEDEVLDWQMENDPRFIQMMEKRAKEKRDETVRMRDMLE